MVRYSAKRGEVGQRLDVSATNHLDGISRSMVSKLCDDGKIQVNKVVEKASYKLRKNDKVVVDFSPADLEQIPPIDLPVLYEDDDCVVINKPVGILSHSKGAFNPEATVATWLQQHISTTSTANTSTAKPWKSSKDVITSGREGIVHRLDRATSGVMIGAKTPEALSWLQKQFSQRKVKKTYMAVVEGQLEPAEAIIDMPIERNPKHPQTFRAGPNGKPAQTEYKAVKYNGSKTLVELKPKTGRTHQLRVHLKQLKHPILGDTLYGGGSANRLYLHALSLEVTLPNRQRKVFVAPLPTEFLAIMA